MKRGRRKSGRKLRRSGQIKGRRKEIKKKDVRKCRSKRDKRKR
jgi:hypothetical protein